MKLINDKAYEYFINSTGGSNRNWTKRYAKMIAKYEVLTELASTKEEKAFLKGFKNCLDTFHGNGNKEMKE